MKGIVQRFLGEWIFPAYCQECRQLIDGLHEEKGVLCPACQSRLHSLKEPLCPRCAHPLEEVFSPCPNCAKRRLFFEFCACGIERCEISRRLLFFMKYTRYGRGLFLVNFFGELVARTLLADARFLPYREEGALLIPVPLDMGRMSTRLFNQSELIAQRAIAMSPRLSGAAPLELLCALRRRTTRGSQARLSRKMRLQRGLEKSFFSPKKYRERLHNRRVILVDDVFTTGETANACSKVLLEAGALKVSVLCALRSV